MTTQRLHRGELWRYSIFAIPVAFAGFPLYVLAPDYYATNYGVSLSLLAIALLVLRLFDAIQDPLIGVLSDRYRHRSTTFMVAASLILCASIFGLFNLTFFSPLVWFSLCMLCAVSAFSVLSINLNALGGLWKSHSELQTHISAFREACALIGLVIAVSLPSFLNNYVSAEDTYIYFSLILCILMVLAWIGFFPWLKKHSFRVIHQKRSISLLNIIIHCPRSTQKFLSIYGLSMFASSIPAALVIFFVRDVIHAEAYLGIFLLCYFLSGAAAMPLWKYLSSKKGMYHSWMIAMILAVVTFIWAFFVQSGDIWQYGLICILSGCALGADLALPPAILANHMYQQKTESSAASQFALLALLAKLGLALASAVTLPLLDLTGFTPASNNSENALFYVSLAYALIPCTLKLTAAIALWWIFIHIKGDGYENVETHRLTGSSYHA